MADTAVEREVDRYVGDAANVARHQDLLIRAVKIPSVSMESRYKPEMEKSAAYWKTQFEALGCEADIVRIADTPPAVYARRIVNPDLPTVMVYGHHDVQPADISDGWKGDPFTADIRDGNLYARGAIDDKGQVAMHASALETLIAVCKEQGVDFPCNLEYVIEGGEEVGSKNFDKLIKHVQEMRGNTRCDMVVVSDTPFVAMGFPSICVGLRGMVQLELTLTGPSTDQHSGAKGGGILNPNDALVYIASRLKNVSPVTDADGFKPQEVRVPGFYDGVNVSEQTRQESAELPFEISEWRKDAGGVADTFGLPGWTTVERTTVLPTLELNSLGGGHQGEGIKTSITSKAMAKITCRLVPGQDPVKIAASVKAAIEMAAADFIGDNQLPLVQADVQVGHMAPPVSVPVDDPMVQATAGALADAFGHSTVFYRGGGSIPAVTELQNTMQAPVVLAGVGLPDDRMHGPNEKITLSQYHGGIRAFARLWLRVGQALGGPAAPESQLS